MSTKMINTLNELMEEGLSQNLIHHYTEDTNLTGRTITVNNKELLNFGSCSYLGLEYHPALKQGVIDAVERYGTQFSSSRTYASLGLYKELEDNLFQIYGKPSVVTASTTLGHFATIPVIVEKDDAVILDMQVHNSVQMATQLLKAEGVSISIIRHNDMDMLEDKIKTLRNKHKKIWYFADGVYSMYGDYAPLDRLVELMDTYEQFHLYIDDAHGIGWAGKNGSGYVRSQIEHHSKMVLAGSLNKSFATAGGFVIFPNDEMAKKVRNCGGTMIFCGPIQPPMLGAAIASTRLHLSEEIEEHQKNLADLIAYTNDRIRELGLPQFMETDSPLFFIPAGLPKINQEMIRRIHKDGVYVNTAAFPATPMKRGGIRFMINGNMKREDVDELLRVLAYHYPRVLADLNSSPKHIAKTFRIPEFTIAEDIFAKADQAPEKVVGADLKVIRKKSIHEITPQEWDSLMAERGNFTHDTLQMLEYVFSEKHPPENNWSFYYIKIEDKKGNTVLNTFYTSTILKDDMFSSAAVSQQVEEMREKDPYYLTSRSVILGSPITKGSHLFLDREHADWKGALNLLIQEMQQTMEEKNATQLMLREFRKGADEELKSVLLDLGLIEVDIPNECLMTDLSWKDQDEYLKGLGGKYRYNVRKEILPFMDKFEMDTTKPLNDKEIKECYNLYCNVADQAYELNVHKLPYSYFEGICTHPDYDIIRLYLKDDPRPKSEKSPVAVMFSHKKEGSDNYQALIVGLDYKYVRTYNTYKQILFRTVWRAWELGANHLDLAFTAELEKKKIGARPYPVCIYMQSTDHFNQAIIASMGQAAAKVKSM